MFRIIWVVISIGQLKCDGTCTETKFHLLAKWTNPFKSVQSSTGNRGVCISGSNAGYTMFRGGVKITGYPLHLHFFPFTSPTLRHRVPSGFSGSLPWLTQFRSGWDVHCYVFPYQHSDVTLCDQKWKCCYKMHGLFFKHKFQENMCVVEGHFFHSFHWHVRHATIPCRSRELLPFHSVVYFFQPPFCTNYSSILSHLILPSISWSASQSCCSKIHI